MKSKNALDSYFSEIESKDEFSGVVLITQGKKRIYQGAFGYASRAWHIQNSLSIRFDTASITKLFTAVAILQLVDQKLLTLETGAIDYLELNGTAISKKATVFHLLTHTSGIGDDCEEENGENYEVLWKTKPNYSVTETQDFLPQFGLKKANFPPGEGCRYCNCGYVLLGMMIEKATASRYRDYVRREIFKKSGMVLSDFYRMDRVHKDVAEGCDPIRDQKGKTSGWKRNIYSYPPVGSPDSGAYVTAGNLDRFLRAVRGRNLLSSELTEAFFSPQVLYRKYDGWSKKYGFGMWFYVDSTEKVVFCEKENINTGVSGVVRYYPETDINVVILSNMENGVWGPIRKIHQMVATSERSEE